MSLFYDKNGVLRIVFHAHESKENVGNRLMYIGTVKLTSTRISMTKDPIIRPKIFTQEVGLEKVEGSSLTDENIYDLSGRKVNSQVPTSNSQLKNGIYIKNGRKELK